VVQLLATEDRVRDAAAETLSWKEKAEALQAKLSETQSDLTDTTRERDFLSARLLERESEVPICFYHADYLSIELLTCAAIWLHLCIVTGDLESWCVPV
jgi:hypothetical protein